MDEILYVAHYPEADGKARVLRRVRSCGGLTATALVTASKVGARAAFAGRLGNDGLSREVELDLRHHEVDVSEIIHRADACPGLSTIVIAEERGTRAVFSEVRGTRGADDELPAESVLRDTAVLFVDGHGVKGSIRAARIARNSGAAVVADFERGDHGDFAALLGLVDHLVVSARFASELTGVADPRDAAQRLWTPGRSAVVVTCGAKGGLSYTGSGEPTPYSAFPVATQDTAGCGDVFHGAYAAALAFGWPLARRIEFASAAAALKASGCGRQAIPDRARIVEFLDDEFYGVPKAEPSVRYSASSKP